MAFVFSIGRELAGAVQVGEACFCADNDVLLSLSDDHVTLFKGELFDIDLEQARELVRAHGIEALLAFQGEYCFVHYKASEKKISFGTDRTGRESLFYYHKSDELVLSDDFWYVASVIDAGPNDIDAQHVKEMAVFHYPLFFGTIIRNLSFTPPATVATFDLIVKDLALRQYWELRYRPDYNQTVDEAVDQLDNALDQAFATIRKLNPSASFGVGLSGGLDSRLIPYYAARQGLPLSSFIIGEKAPHGVLLSRDHRSARQLAEFYDLEHTEVEFDSEPFDVKMYRDIRNFPIGPSQFFISVSDTVPYSDVLLTGASGMLVGAEVPQTIEGMTAHQITDAIVKHSNIIRTSGTRKKLVRVANEFLGLNIQDKNHAQKLMDAVITPDEYRTAVAKVEEFVTNHLASGKTSLDTFQNYFFFYLGSRNKKGAFESLQGTRKCYSVYAPFLLDLTLTWKPDLLFDRVILKRLISTRLPELAQVKAQDYKVSITGEANATWGQRVLALGEYVLRGSGVGRQEIWAKQSRYRKYAQRIWEKPNTVFSSLFDIAELSRAALIAPRYYEKLIKLKVLLDLIESGTYKDFFQGATALPKSTSMV